VTASYLQGSCKKSILLVRLALFRVMVLDFGPSLAAIGPKFLGWTPVLKQKFGHTCSFHSTLVASCSRRWGLANTTAFESLTLKDLSRRAELCPSRSLKDVVYWREAMLSYALAPTSKNRNSSAATTSGLFSGIKCPESTTTHLDCGIKAAARSAKPSGTAVSREP